MENHDQLPAQPADPYDILHMLQTAVLAPSTCQKYTRAVARYLATEHTLADQHALATYAATLSPSSRSYLKSAIKKWSQAMAVVAKGQATPENIHTIQASLLRFEALQETIQAPIAKGQKVHTWLSPIEVRQLLRQPDTQTPLGRRDKLALGLCVAAGLRREEAVAVRFADILELPLGAGQRTVINVQGKGAKNRAVPIKQTLAADLAAWGAEIGTEGLVLRSLGRGNRLGGGLTAVSLFRIVAKYGRQMGQPELAPHDLRRTYAQLGYEAGIPLTQISVLLGHSNIETTRRYLNLNLDMTTTVSDFIPYDR